ncbi:coiled-coil domain-containing protein 66-like [Limulus polyphemus]|uniref:Coiled-coil domain-containing protein 66-like n=1 Tax=Limulus polyphemus TaxID=6850 RepID=A0ABM1T8T6_LIMPO|nr:coiled-coil domain-containing protein 66-like [Limulus polyphemus]
MGPESLTSNYKNILSCITSLNNTTVDRSTEETVTLTKAQLRALLDVIGQTRSLSLDIGENKNSDGNKKDEGGVMDMNSNYYTYQRTDDGGLPNWAHRNSTPGFLPNPTSPCRISASSPPLNNSATFPRRRSFSQPEIAGQALSKVEQKRLQWEREREEMQVYDPWGKPGAGAPLQRHNSVAVVGPTPSSQLVVVHTSCSQPTVSSRNSASTTSGGHSIASYASPSQTYSRHIPPILRSSLPFGPNSNNVAGEDVEHQQREWVHVLGKQREEQRQRRALEHQQNLMSPSPEGAWFNVFKDTTDARPSSLSGGPAHLATSDLTTVVQLPVGFPQKEIQDCPLLSTSVPEREHSEQRCVSMGLSAVGYHIPSAISSPFRCFLKEAHLGLMFVPAPLLFRCGILAILYAVEQEERKRQVLLDAVNQAQAAAEADKKARKAQRLGRQKVVSDSDETNSLSHYHAQNNHSYNPNDGALSDPELARHTDSPLHASRSEIEDSSEKTPRYTQQMARVQPVQTVEHQWASDNNLTQDTSGSTNREFAVQTTNSTSATVVHSPYIENRILTPSKHRLRAKQVELLGREFGTQTETDTSEKWLTDNVDADSTTSSEVHPYRKKFHRVQHSKPTKASRKVFERNFDDPRDRPKWNANQPEKSFVKMTERDPNFHRRKKMQELRKQHWERERAYQEAMAEARRSVISTRKTRKNIHLSQAPLSSEGEGGQESSSDVENRPAPFYRSNLPPVLAIRKDLIPSHIRPGLVDDFNREDCGPTTNNQALSSGYFSDNVYSRKLSETPEFPPIRRRWYSQENFNPPPPVIEDPRSISPPVPAIQKKLMGSSMEELSSGFTPRRKWSDQDNFNLGGMAISQPVAHRRTSQDSRSDLVPEDPLRGDPLVNPETVTGRPTPRQDRILQQLSSLRQGLMEKQKELEMLFRTKTS